MRRDCGLTQFFNEIAENISRSRYSPSTTSSALDLIAYWYWLLLQETHFLFKDHVFQPVGPARGGGVSEIHVNLQLEPKVTLMTECKPCPALSSPEPGVGSSNAPHTRQPDRPPHTAG